jgi:hypothetical protein
MGGQRLLRRNAWWWRQSAANPSQLGIPSSTGKYWETSRKVGKCRLQASKSGPERPCSLVKFPMPENWEFASWFRLASAPAERLDTHSPSRSSSPGGKLKSDLRKRHQASTLPQLPPKRTSYGVQLLPLLTLTGHSAAFWSAPSPTAKWNRISMQQL